MKGWEEGRRGVWSTRKSREMRATGDRSGREGRRLSLVGHLDLERPIWGDSYFSFLSFLLLL